MNYWDKDSNGNWFLYGGKADEESNSQERCIERKEVQVNGRS